MAGIPVSGLPPIISPASSDIFPIVQSGVTYKETVTQLQTFLNANLTFLPLSGGTMSGAINMGGFKISNAANPTLAQDLATKNYVDTIATGGGAPVIAATTGALTVTQSGAGVGATLTNAGAQATLLLDGQNPTVGQRVLIKNQASNTQNGVYTVTNVGSGATNWVLTRAVDYDTPADINATSLIPVSAGTVNANTGWINTTLMVTVDTTAITFIQFGISYPVSLVNGGTNASLTASNGGIFYSTASAAAILAGTATAGQFLVSGSNTAPTWQNKVLAANLPTGTMFNFNQGQLPTPVVITSNSTWTSVSGLSIAITPTSASNKVLVRAVFTASAGDANNIPMFRLYNTTAAIPLGVGGSVGSRTPASSCYYIATANPNQIIPVILEWLDSPATTSTTTYTVQVFAANVTTATTLSLGATATDTDNGFFPRTVSTISVCEISA